MRRSSRRSCPTTRACSATTSRTGIAPRFFFTSLDDYVRACSERDWEGARLALEAVNHFARLRRRGVRLRWKLFWIQRPHLFRLLVSLNDRLPYRTRFVRNPNVTLR